MTIKRDDKENAELYAFWAKNCLDAAKKATGWEKVKLWSQGVHYLTVAEKYLLGDRKGSSF